MKITRIILILFPEKNPRKIKYFPRNNSKIEKILKEI